MIVNVKKFIASGLQISTQSEKRRLASIYASAMLWPGGLMRFLEQL